MAERELVRHELHGMQPVLGVRSMQETLAYYRDMLPHRLRRRRSRGARPRLFRPHLRLALRVHPFRPLEPGASPTLSAWLWLHVGTGLDNLFRTYQARGAAIVQEPQDRPWGLRQFIIKDCNDCLVSFSEELP